MFQTGLTGQSRSVWPTALHPQSFHPKFWACFCPVPRTVPYPVTGSDDWAFSGIPLRAGLWWPWTPHSPYWRSRQSYGQTVPPLEACRYRDRHNKVQSRYHPVSCKIPAWYLRHPVQAPVKSRHALLWALARSSSRYGKQYLLFCLPPLLSSAFS